MVLNFVTNAVMSSMTKKTLLTIVGPTAIGKTDLSIAFAKAYQTAIISCDSRQCYKEMNIGTAAPTLEEQAAATHYFIQDRSIHNPMSAGDFEKEALTILNHLFEENDVVIMVGGSALFEKAVTHGLDDFPDVPDSILDELENQLKEKGISSLQQELIKVDPEYANQVDMHNSRRLLRALSLYRASGKTMQELRSGNEQERNFQTIKIGLEAPRETLYDRINQRVDLMIDNGLIEEAKSLLPFKELTALQTVGYQELFPYFENKIDLDEAIRLIKRNSRRFAKRQMTWYRKDNQVHWFNYSTRHTEIVQRVHKLLIDRFD